MFRYYSQLVADLLMQGKKALLFGKKKQKLLSICVWDGSIMDSNVQNGPRLFDRMR